MATGVGRPSLGAIVEGVLSSCGRTAGHQGQFSTSEPNCNEGALRLRQATGPAGRALASTGPPFPGKSSGCPQLASLGQLRRRDSTGAPAAGGSQGAQRPKAAVVGRGGNGRSLGGGTAGDQPRNAAPRREGLSAAAAGVGSSWCLGVGGPLTVDAAEDEDAAGGNANGGTWGGRGNRSGGTGTREGRGRCSGGTAGGRRGGRNDGREGARRMAAASGNAGMHSTAARSAKAISAIPGR